MNFAPWLKFTLRHPPAAAEAAGGLLFEAGAASLWEDRPDERGRLVTRAGFAPEDLERLTSLGPGIVDRLAEGFGLDLGEFDFELELEEGRDWAEKWKEGLRPVRVSPALAVAPTWWPENELPASAVVLRLDPGLAFGSGHHATTWLCLKLLTDLAPGASRILDLGFGSGILALAATALNPAAQVSGLDNDPETLAVAQANAALNGLAGRVDFILGNLAEAAANQGSFGPFDLIASNLTLAPLLTLSPFLTGLAEPSGRLILSGLLDSQASAATSAYEARGWALERRLRREEWAALVLGRAESGRTKELEIKELEIEDWQEFPA